MEQIVERIVEPERVEAVLSVIETQYGPYDAVRVVDEGELRHIFCHYTSADAVTAHKHARAKARREAAR